MPPFSYYILPDSLNLDTLLVDDAPKQKTKKDAGEFSAMPSHETAPPPFVLTVVVHSHRTQLGQWVVAGDGAVLAAVVATAAGAVATVDGAGADEWNPFCQLSNLTGWRQGAGRQVCHC